MPLTHFEIRGRREQTQGQASVVINPPPDPQISACLKGSLLDDTLSHWECICSTLLPGDSARGQPLDSCSRYGFFESGQQSQGWWVLWVLYRTRGVVGGAGGHVIGCSGLGCALSGGGGGAWTVLRAVMVNECSWSVPQRACFFFKTCLWFYCTFSFLPWFPS